VTIGPVTVYSYGLMLALAFVAGGLYARYALIREGHDPTHVYNLLLAAMLGGIVGARLFYVLANWGDFAANPIDVFFIPGGGLVFQGGALGGALAVWAVAAYERLSLPMLMDVAAPGLGIAAAIGRVGCFANGCCVGRPTTAWYGMAFIGYPEPRVPIQLADMGYNLVIFGVLAWLATRPHRQGDLLWMWVAGYGVARFVIEFWRAVPAGVSPDLAPVGLNPIAFAGLTLPQLYALAMWLFGVAMLARGRLWGTVAVEEAEEREEPAPKARKGR
jgi:phosphatidylglycerol---prolipoprotein diacylglyceryl transferase